MKKLLILIFALLILSSTVLAHGGQYRGPGDIVPPGGGGGGRGPVGPTTPTGPGGPSTPGGGPTTPGGPGVGPAAPGPGGGPVTPGGSRGIQIDDDFSKWAFWWEFNKDRYIKLKKAINSGEITTGSDDFFLGATKSESAKDILRPSEEAIREKIMPALKKNLDSRSSRDIISSCMVALAKIGKDHKDFKLYDCFVPQLKSKDQEIRETAALCLGLAGIASDETLTTLVNLVKDNKDGRLICDRAEVDDRTRSFATYALGLLANYNQNDDVVRRKCLDVFVDILKSPELSSRNLKVAAINSIALLKKD